MPHIEHEPTKPVAQVTAQCHIIVAFKSRCWLSGAWSESHSFDLTGVPCIAYLSRFAVSCASDLVGSQDLKVYQIATNQVTKVVSTVPHSLVL